MSTWTQLWVKHPNPALNTPTTMQRAEEVIGRMGGLFVAPQGTPIKTRGDAYEVRVFGPAAIVRRMLVGYCELEVVEETTHPD